MNGNEIVNPSHDHDNLPSMQVKQKTLIIWGENDQIIDYKLAVVSLVLVFAI